MFLFSLFFFLPHSVSFPLSLSLSPFTLYLPISVSLSVILSIFHFDSFFLSLILTLSPHLSLPSYSHVFGRRENVDVFQSRLKAQGVRISFTQK